jgi:hypothetical protein
MHMRERQSRRKEEAHLAAPFDYSERTGSEKVQRADEKDKKENRSFEIHSVLSLRVPLRQINVYGLERERNARRHS